MRFLCASLFCILYTVCFILSGQRQYAFTAILSFTSNIVYNCDLRLDIIAHRYTKEQKQFQAQITLRKMMIVK